jgi:hypothetical protein
VAQPWDWSQILWGRCYEDSGSRLHPAVELDQGAILALLNPNRGPAKPKQLVWTVELGKKYYKEQL